MPEDVSGSKRHAPDTMLEAPPAQPEWEDDPNDPMTTNNLITVEQLEWTRDALRERAAEVEKELVAMLNKRTGLEQLKSKLLARLKATEVLLGAYETPDGELILAHTRASERRMEAKRARP